MGGIKLKERWLPPTIRLEGKLIEKVQQLKIIDNLILSSNLREEIKKATIKGILLGHIESKLPSLQQILRCYLSALNKSMANREMFILCVKAGILLIRSLEKTQEIRLTKTGKYAPYILGFEAELDRLTIREEYYNDKIHFKGKKKPYFEGERLDPLEIVENTPIFINKEYFKII